MLPAAGGGVVELPVVDEGRERNPEAGSWLANKFGEKSQMSPLSLK
jgi:hypothetical protein